MGLRFDRRGAQAIISWQHHLVHMGQMFHISDVALAVDIASPVQYLIRPAVDHHLHIGFETNADKGFSLAMFSGPTVTGVGTEMLTIACNQDDPGPRAFMAFVGATVSADGTLMIVDRRGAATVGQTKIVSQRAEGQEKVLKRGIDYLIRVTPLSNDTNISFGANVYE